MLPNGFSDYIAYADESGDHSLTNIDSKFPLFALVFCVFRVNQYVRDVVPAIQELKFSFFGHDQVILHEIDIRRRNPPFGILHDYAVRERFLTTLGQLIEHTEMTVIATVIDKQKLFDAGVNVGDPYELALQSCMERMHMFLRGEQMHERTTHIVFESRGAAEDQRLLRTFDEIRRGQRTAGRMPNLRYEFASKRSNSTGLQLADLIARPIALQVFRPNQPNRAYTTFASKLWRDADGNVRGRGLKVFPDD